VVVGEVPWPLGRQLQRRPRQTQAPLLLERQQHVVQHRPAHPVGPGGETSVEVVVIVRDHEDDG
jgi:hypothetical protein